jgi:hypothetical protein
MKHTCKTTQRKTTMKSKTMPHRKTKSETSNPEETAHSKQEAGKVNLALT